ncbi:ribosomal protein S18-alanine N-acetyltransferase [Nesterenkonia alba]|uniref:ribosomal protein S18-alanine N-acetyltransferase n=1 Tax=Nesterenkonia alba TaxID=515814 RepID=UPI0003B453AE|nr:ribosomal protein S18-alanine N-acetyltransferase [Nesterenkonia alba]
MTELIARAMRTADIPAVLALERQLFPHDAWPEEFFRQELAQADERLPANQRTRRFWVVEEAGRIIGYAGMMCVLPLADVQTVAVDPAYQGRGLGSWLMGLIEDEARRRGADDLLLEVRADNPGAQRLYRRLGFEQIHLRRSYYPDGGDALVMRKSLEHTATAPAAPAKVGPVGSELASSDTGRETWPSKEDRR